MLGLSRFRGLRPTAGLEPKTETPSDHEVRWLESKGGVAHRRSTLPIALLLAFAVMATISLTWFGHALRKVETPQAANSEPRAESPSPPNTLTSGPPLRQIELSPQPVAPELPTPAAPIAQAAPGAPVSAPTAAQSSPLPAPATVASAAEQPDEADQSAANVSIYFDEIAVDQTDARSKVIELQRKYASLLGARRLSYKGVKVGTGLNFHVRLARIAKAEADGLCTQIRTQGGGCQVGPN